MDIEKVLVCFHCGNKTAMKEIAKYTHKDTDEIWNYSISINEPIDFVTFTKVWHLFLCPVCINVTLVEHEYNTEELAPNGKPLSNEEIIYPFKAIQQNNIPEGVSRAFESALKTRQIDGTICAIAIRRTLEMMCKDRGGEGKTLYDKLKSLSEKGILPPILNEMASVLRIIGNSTAHADETNFSQDLVSSMIEFTQIILDYVYNLPKQIEQVQNSLSKLLTTSSNEVIITQN